MLIPASSEPNGVTATVELSPLRCPVGAAVASAVAVVALRFVDERVPGASSLPYVLLAGGAVAVGIRVGRDALAQPVGSRAGPLARGAVGWGLVFPAAFFVSFAALQRLLLVAVPGSSSALVAFFLGRYVASLGAVAAGCFLPALATTAAYGRLRAGHGTDG